MKTIQLTQGQVALVDDEDYDFLNQWKWNASKSKKDHTFYAKRIEYLPGGLGKVRKTIPMHRLILGITSSNLVDHEDHNGLNNQRYNLREVTVSQNKMNVNSYKGSTSSYLGVSWDNEQKKWISQIKVQGKRKYLGRFVDEKLAAEAYNKAAIVYHKEFANLNVI